MELLPHQFWAQSDTKVVIQKIEKNKPYPPGIRFLDSRVYIPIFPYFTKDFHLPPESIIMELSSGHMKVLTSKSQICFMNYVSRLWKHHLTVIWLISTWATDPRGTTSVPILSSIRHTEVVLQKKQTIPPPPSGIRFLDSRVYIENIDQIYSDIRNTWKTFRGKYNHLPSGRSLKSLEEK